MRTRKAFSALIGIAFILQACGNQGVVPTNSPSITEPVPSVTEPSVTESTTTIGPAAEFFSPIPFRSGLGFRAPWFELYFIDPTNPFAQREVGSVDALVAASIIAARQSVLVAMISLSLKPFATPLFPHSPRPVPVRVVA